MKTFSVKNFERFQHYKDRAPPWIKLYNELLDDYEFGLLPDASKMHLIAIWLLASRSDNKIPYDPMWVARRINATEPVNLAALLDAGFIVEYQSLQNTEHVASTTLAVCLSREETEKSREETEKREISREREANKPVKSNLKTLIIGAFAFSTSVKQYAGILGFTGNEIDLELPKFIRHHKKHGTRFADWDSAAESWFDKAAEFAGKRPIGAPIDDGMVEVINEDQLMAWDAYAVSRGAKRFPRNSRGGWRFPSAWPPGHQTQTSH